jgi:hypothetical protein
MIAIVLGLSGSEMSDDAKPKFEVPWGTLLPLLAALAGVVASIKPLVSTRPPAAAEKAVPVIALQDVDARLWQDPIAVAQKQKSALFAEMSSGVVPKERAQIHDIATLQRLIFERAKQPARTLLLGVMIDPGPYSEQGEIRLRTRQAVLEGLSESGFVPRDAEHIGYVTSPWPLPRNPQGTTPPRTTTGDLLIPWEECEMDNRGRVFPPNTSSAIVLWLPATNFTPNPLTKLAELIDTLTAGARDKVDVRLLGPANSSGLQSMVREVRSSDWKASWQNPESSAVLETIDGLTIVSARATAADDMLFYDPSLDPAQAAALQKMSVQQLIEQAVPRGTRHGLHFIRSIATDDRVLKALIDELKLRRVPMGSIPEGTKSNMPYTILLSEWDTPFGRSLGISFEAQAYGESITQIIARRTAGVWRRPGQQRPRLQTYRYLRGIDGQLPGDPARGSEPATKQTGQNQPAAIESTEGLNQSDYLRRLARLLAENDSYWRRTNGVGIGAIGLLGSDIYDKLMILRALRPQFPSAIFFTNTYDSHFERADDLDDTHNLVIGSPFGSSLPDNLWLQRVAPFRDSNQTAVYLGTLVATGRVDEKVALELATQPRVFEIGRKGAVELSEPWHVTGRPPSRTKHRWFSDWLWSDGVWWHLVIAGIALALIVGWVSASNAHRSLAGGGTTPERLARVFSSTPFWVICGPVAIVLLVALYAQTPQARLEPFAFFSGVSIWPSEMVRLVGLVLAIHFMIKASIDMRANEREIEHRFCLDPLPPSRFQLTDIGLGLEFWQMSERARAEADQGLNADVAWHAYLRRNKFWPRFIRVGILFALYFIFALFLFTLFPRSIPPARGEAAFGFDSLVLLPSVMALWILSFYVVDAIQLNSNLIRLFVREVTRWGRGVAEKSQRSPPLTEEELSAYNEIFFVAQRTHVVARLIWYPLIVLSILIVARWSFFDNWSWPAGLIIVFLLNASWALGSAIYLRRAAEQLRAAALDNLALLRLGAFSNEVRRRAFDELIVEIRSLKKGAFAPLSEQPFIRAVLFPSGGLGLLAVAQRVIELF